MSVLCRCVQLCLWGLGECGCVNMSACVCLCERVCVSLCERVCVSLCVSVAMREGSVGG